MPGEIFFVISQNNWNAISERFNLRAKRAQIKVSIENDPTPPEDNGNLIITLSKLPSNDMKTPINGRAIRGPIQGISYIGKNPADFIF